MKSQPGDGINSVTAPPPLHRYISTLEADKMNKNSPMDNAIIIIICITILLSSPYLTLNERFPEFDKKLFAPLALVGLTLFPIPFFLKGIQFLGAKIDFTKFMGVSFLCISAFLYLLVILPLWSKLILYPGEIVNASSASGLSENHLHD